MRYAMEPFLGPFKIAIFLCYEGSPNQLSGSFCLPQGLKLFHRVPCLILIKAKVELEALEKSLSLRVENPSLMAIQFSSE